MSSAGSSGLPAVPPAGGGIDLRKLVRRDSAAYRPWTSETLARAFGVQALALIFILVSWYEAAGSTSLHGQMSWLRLGLLGLLVSGVGNGLWLLRGRQMVGLARGYTLAPFEPAVGLPPAVEAAPADQRPATAAAELRYSVPRATRYHRFDCPLVSDKILTAAAVHEHVAAGRTACELCEP